MPNVVITTDLTATVRRTNNAVDELAINVTGTGSVVAPGTGIRGLGGAVTVTVEGSVEGRRAVGVHLGADRGGDVSNALYVRAGGEVAGATAVRFDSYGTSVLNLGTIAGTATGILLGGVDADEISTIMNRGAIEGGGAAIRIAAGTTEGVTIENLAGATIRETGTGRDAIVSDASTGLGLVVRNAGTIQGNVQMGGTADLYQNLGGTVAGTVFGRGGRDVFEPGRGAERIDGGAGFDRIDFGDGGGVRVTLGGAVASNAGAARGDTYLRVEAVTGSFFGRDVLTGSRAGNLLDGQGGRDVLSGGRGADQLVGGAGRDALTGGRGNDAFVFASAAQGRDTITDFGRGPGNDDRFRFDDAGFGGGLDTGALDASQFRRSAAANTGADADDRFVFRTGDTTLWFDRDGAGGAGPVQIANLQAGAVVTAADIFIF